MRYNRLDLNLLVALDALLTERSVSRAAERVFLSQPAMSNALARLRAHYGDELIVPIGRRMVLTERGSSLQREVREVREVMLRIHQVAQPADRFDPATHSRTFKIAASDYFALVFLPELLRHCAEHAPSICLDVQTLSPKLSEELDRGDIDLLIVPEVFRFAQHPSRQLFEEHWVCVADKANKAVGRVLTEEKYLACTHVVKRENHAMFQPMDELVLGRRKLLRRVAGKVPQYGLLPPAVVGTAHLATVQRRLADHFAAFLPIRILALPMEFPPLVELMQWHQVRDADLGHRWLRETVAHVCARMTRSAGRKKR